jgi:hypothetical protein
MMRFPFFVCKSLPPPPPRHSARAAAASPADSDNNVPIPRLSHPPALVSCFGDAVAPHLRTSFCSSTPPIRPQPAPPAGSRCPLENSDSLLDEQ